MKSSFFEETACLHWMVDGYSFVMSSSTEERISHFGAFVGLINMQFESFLRALNTHLDLKQKFLLASSQLDQQLLLLRRQI